MTVYSWTVIINQLPYGEKAQDPWTAVSRALKKWRKQHPESEMMLFDIYIANKTLLDKKEEETQARKLRI